jgi:PAS domain S-box-containing protein
LRSYLAVPVVARNGEVLGGLFFGHAEAGVFNEVHERLLAGVAGQAGVAIDNARLYQNSRAAAQRLDLAMVASQLGDWSWDVRSDVVTMSERAAAIFGIPPGPVMTWTSMRELLHPLDREPTRLAVERSVADRTQYDVEYRVLRSDGRMVWVGALGHATYNDSGDVVTMYGVVRDVTERKRLEESLRESEGRFRELMEQAPFSVQVFAADGHTLRVNRAWEELWGVTLDQIRDYNLLQDPQLEARGVLPFIRRAFAGEPTRVPAIEYDVHSTLPNVSRYADARRWVAAVAYPLKDEQGAVQEVVIVHDDITARKQAEEALEESQGVYRAIGESIDYGVWICDPDGKNIYASDSFLRLVGLTQAECSEFGWSTVLHPDDAAGTIEAWKACVAAGAMWDVEHRFRGVDGQWHHVLARGVPVRNLAGEIVAWAGINLDISRIKQVEDELRVADRRKDEFLATLAHELRNPLAPIRTGLELLKQTGGDPATFGDVVETMERQLRQLVALVDDLLDVSRITRGKLDLRRSRVRLGDVVQSGVEAARPIIDESRHQLHVQVPAAPLMLDVDPHRLAQVLSNLLNNAAKYTPAGGRIELDIARDGRDLVLIVRDNGVGIPVGKAEHIFEMFAQLEQAAEQGQPGLGIGLTLVKSLVQLHGGTIGVDSPGLGRGSTFTVRLPVVVEEASQAPAADAAATAPVRRRKVLVVDDNTVAATLLARILKLLGHDVATAGDGEQALSRGAEFHPEVVLMDLGMPRLNGYEAATQMRGSDWGRRAILVALSGWGQADDKRRSNEAGFDEHLVKPVEVATLKQLFVAIDRGAFAPGGRQR